jgi:hydrogenase-4 membrane subunit HyfE
MKLTIVYLTPGLLVVASFALRSHHQVRPQAALAAAAAAVLAAVLVLDAVF